MNRKTQRDLLILLGVYLLTRSSSGGGDWRRGSTLSPMNPDGWPNPSLNDLGARLFELLNPSQTYPRADHRGLNASDRPSTQRRPQGKGEQLPPDVVLTIAQLAGFPDPKLAAAIAMAESGGWTNNINSNAREYSVGLWQINTKVHPYTPADMADPMKNAAAAFQISRGGTYWKPWSVFTQNKYQAHQRGVLA